MKFDTIIIGGGLSGLACGIKLQKAGQKCAIVSAGQNAMHFSSGSFGLLSRLPDGTMVKHPLEGIKALEENADTQSHPYAKIGFERMKEYIEFVPEFFMDCGIKLNGKKDENSYMISPTGDIQTVWKSMEDINLLEEKGLNDNNIADKNHCEKSETKTSKTALIANFLGYMDFNVGFIRGSLEDRGVKCRRENIKLKEMEHIRKSPSEMRAVNISRVLDNEDILNKFVDEVLKLIKDEDIVILPAVFGFKNIKASSIVRERIEKTGVKVIFIGTMPPSVPGIRTQLQLKKKFEDLGGIFLMGDSVIGAKKADEKHILKEIFTSNLEDFGLQAENFVLATGGLFSKGLVAEPGKFREPIFDIDVDYNENRNSWYDANFFAKQPYMTFGVKTTKELKALKEGKTIDNLFVCGSILEGCDSLYEGSGAGVAIMTGFAVADNILNSRHNN